MTSFFDLQSFATAVAIVCGIFGPLGAIYIIITICKAVQIGVHATMYCIRYSRFMDPQHWHFVKVEQPPNKEYISLVFMNGESRGKISLGVEKKYLREFLRGGE